MTWSLVIPAFIAGFLTFLAPCTLPLVPGYLAFMSGVSLNDIQDPFRERVARRRILVNSVLYVIGFSTVFIGFGTVFGGIGGFVSAPARMWLGRLGGFFVFLFGIYMMRVFELPFFRFLDRDIRLAGLTRPLTPGKPLSSFLFGATFALGWTPCIGPILGSILLLVSTTGTLVQGAFLLAVFSFGLGLPFLLLAFMIGYATKAVHRFQQYLRPVSIIGGIFLVFLGLLMMTRNMGIWLQFAYQAFQSIRYDSLQNYL